MTPARTICPNCGAQYVADGIAGLCPACLLKKGVANGEDTKTTNELQQPAMVEGIIYRTNSDEDFDATYVTGKKGWF